METQIPQYTKEEIKDDTRTGVLLRALAKGSELQGHLGDRLVLNAFRVESFADMKRSIFCSILV